MQTNNSKDFTNDEMKEIRRLQTLRVARRLASLLMTPPKTAHLSAGAGPALTAAFELAQSEEANNVFNVLQQEEAHAAAKRPQSRQPIAPSKAMRKLNF